MAILLAVVSSLAYGVADFCGGVAARRTHVLKVVAISAPASLLVELAVLPFLGASWAPMTLVWGLTSGVASAFAFVLLYLTLARGPMTVLSPVTAIVSALLPLMVGLAGGEPLSLQLLGGVAAAVIAIMLIAGGSLDRAVRHSVSWAGIGLACAAGAAIAMQLIALDQAPSDSGVAPLIVGRTASSVLLLGALLIRLRRLPSGRPPVTVAIIAGALDSLANLFFLLAARGGELGVSAVIVAQYPAATVLLAWAVLREHVTVRQLFGFACTAVALALLATA